MISLLSGLATLAGFLGKLWWMFELTSHFPVHQAAVSSGCALVWLFKRTWKWAAFSAACAVINLILVLSVLWPASAAKPAPAGTVKLLALNVHTGNAQKSRVMDYLRQADADVVLLMEVDVNWMRALESLTNLFTLVASDPRSDNFGITLMSRIPSTNAQVVYLGDADVPSITTTLLVHGQPVKLIGTHPVPPGSREYARLRNNQLEAIASEAGRSTLPVVVLGDLNATPWSPFFRKLLRDADLRNSAQGRGMNASWPAFLPIGRIPLDHCLISAELHVHARRVGPDVGSDHLPIEVELGFTGR